MKYSFTTAALATLIGSAVADDVLFSRHLDLSRRDVDSGNWNVSFFHVNDVHAHLDEFSKSGTDCTKPEKGCYGGYARIKNTVDELRKEHPDSLWLNAGDEFQGTLFYSFYGGEKIAETINQVGFDAMTLGNHEWDGGDVKLGEFLANLTFPIISSNVKSEIESLKSIIKPYHIFEDKKLAIIGASTQETPDISNVDPKTKFLDPIKTIQDAVYEIRNTTDVKHIVALTHLGYEVDQKLAAQTEGLSLIIGGHSHTLLGDMEKAEGKYPTIVENTKGEEVFIVTSYRWGEYVGSIELMFNDDDKIVGYKGAPIHLTNTTAVDEELQKQIESWRVPFDEFAKEVLGSTENALVQETCQKGDCLLGQVMADAMLEYRLNANGEVKPDFALINAGGVRAEIDAGEITRGEVLTSFPFGNAIAEVSFKGAQLRFILEGCVSGVNQANGKEIGSWFQVSRGIKVEHNPKNEPGKRLVSVTINDKPLDDEREYKFVTLDFISGGGDNILEKQKGVPVLDLQDEVLVQYIKANTPLKNTLEERVVVTDKQPGEDKPKDGEEPKEGDKKSGAGILKPGSWAAVAAAAGLVLGMLP